MTTRILPFAFALMVISPIAGPAWAVPGDITGVGASPDGIVNIQDVQCQVLAVLSDSGTPPCVKVDPDSVDFNCDGHLDVSDVMIVIQIAMVEALPPSIDPDGDVVLNACDPDDDGDGSPDGCEAARGTDPYDPSSVTDCACLEEGGCVGPGQCTAASALPDGSACGESQTCAEGVCGGAEEPVPEAVALAMALRFYGAQRCGDTDGWLTAQMPAGPTCHLEDGPDLGAGIDLSGGWHDAGDFIKFTLTTAFAAHTLLKGYDAFPQAYADSRSQDDSPTPNGVPDVLDEVRVATDYLLKTHPDPNTLVRRVGGDQDHDNFVTSPHQSTLSVAQGGGQRPVFTGAQADIGGITAAALALAARLMAPYDPAHAQACGEKAASIYALSQSRLGTTWDNYYADDGWRDGMMCGAVELYRLTGDSDYLDDAIAHDVALGPHYWVADWANHADGCRHSLAMAGYTDTLQRWSVDVARYRTHVSDAPFVTGMAWFADWGSLMYATHAAFSSALYFERTQDPDARDFALGQMDYVLGDNEHDRSFVIGFGANAPERPHHANAYGYDEGDWDLSKPFRYLLEGAMVAGPTRFAEGPSTAGYEDDIHDWLGNEVTLSMNAGLCGLLAFGVSQAP